jgi:putative endonuclease
VTRDRRETGLLGEDRAAAALARNGYRILARNYRCRLGEIDLVAEDGDTIVFVEVKARRDASYGGPAMAVTREKQRRIARVALHYLAVNRMLDRRARFDVVALMAGPEGWGVEILKDAFQADG